ncbi:hypothetical protein CRG98_046742 [Punica granatum]|uniref:Uncharacterized protein n=1 Tax=Punica granatum TaxID=22663 RepID=A0A2I0HM99_PUNGR|nr:hypothetical protein CRG98_046742 [Punica granatum]
MAWSSCDMHGFGTTRTVLPRDGGPPTQGCQFLEIERDSFQGLSDSRTARRTPTSNPYLTYAPITGRGSRPIGT